MRQEFETKLFHTIDKEKIRVNESMEKHTTFHIGGPADYFVMPSDVDEVQAVTRLCKQENIPYYDDLYLDIIHCPADNDFTVIVDEDELLDALNTGKITREEFDLANEVCSKLFEEILANKNIFINMDKKELIQRWFK